MALWTRPRVSFRLAARTNGGRDERGGGGGALGAAESRRTKERGASHAGEGAVPLRFARGALIFRVSAVRAAVGSDWTGPEVPAGALQG